MKKLIVNVLLKVLLSLVLINGLAFIALILLNSISIVSLGYIALSGIIELLLIPCIMILKNIK